ncbi:MAG: cytidylyltransferase domain-containing protein [Candidatus Limnocylindrales bacterium]|jgi:spore coat polysaccharide biosynthesis protein SpsF
MRTVGVVQARMGSTRLPGKALADIGGQPLIAWTLDAMTAVRGLDGLIVAITDEPGDDELAAFVVAQGHRLHRGSTHDVLTRCWEAVEPLRPDVIVRETADNPFVDPEIVAAQVRRLVEGGYDYVGTAGWPLGIAAEVASGTALGSAVIEATDAAEREHVMPFLYARPERFRIGSLAPASPPPAGRFTVDTVDDLAFARAIAQRIGGHGPTTIAELGAILADEPALTDLNRGVRQKAWQESER